MKIVALSDLHGTLPMDIEMCDVVCITGDIMPLSIQRDTIKSVSWFLLEFKPWAESLPCDKVVFIAGNHDFMFEELRNGVHSASKVLNVLLGDSKKASKLVYLCDSLYEYKGIRFYGTPWCPDLYNWAFYGTSEDLKEKYNKMPARFDILLSHCPPKVGNAGVVLQEGDNVWNYKSNFGCQELADVIANKDIKWVLCGHIHSGDHNITRFQDRMNIVNVSIKNENYREAYKPFSFEI